MFNFGRVENHLITTILAVLEYFVCTRASEVKYNCFRKLMSSWSAFGNFEEPKLERTQVLQAI